MGGAEGLLVALVVMLVVAASVWLARHVNHPEQTAGHDDPADASGRNTASERFYATTDRPAGPDAEDPVGPTRRDGA